MKMDEKPSIKKHNLEITFRIWDTQNKVYVNNDPFKNGDIYTFEQTDNKFFITPVSTRYKIETSISKLDCKGRQIYFGDVLEKMSPYYLKQGEANYDQKLAEIKEIGEIEDILPTERPYGFGPGVYEIVYIRTGIYSTPLNHIQGQLWLIGEIAGFEEEGFENSRNWCIRSTIHDPKWEFMKNIKTFVNKNGNEVKNECYY